MKRLHIHLAVENLDRNIEFYSSMFGSEPTVQHDDYAKWMLDDPRINFAISNRSSKLGLDHLGLQVDSDDELEILKQQLDVTGEPIETQQGASCCYAQSNKHWILDPQGVAWETFHSLSEIPTFNEADARSDGENPYACRPVMDAGKSKSSCCGG